MTEADQPADGKGEVRPSAGKNQELEDKSQMKRMTNW